MIEGVCSAAHQYSIFRACLDWRNFIGISKKSNSYVLLTSHGVWNREMKFSFSMERLAFLHGMEKIKHPLQGFWDETEHALKCLG